MVMEWMAGCEQWLIDLTRSGYEESRYTNSRIFLSPLCGLCVLCGKIAFLHFCLLHFQPERDRRGVERGVVRPIGPDVQKYNLSKVGW